MYLKTLTLRGFKSFASATTLQLEPGVTCVVGPNGSGKSNVVDALAWVMGEQGAKTLRGGKMEDVIFAGTSGRAPLGRAEVSLTIDNADGALPIDYAEVTISRTLFRSGGSEYAINGSPCRLLDVQELLSDTGMGRQMHVIVGQGQLDAVLRATPEERRGFIEEASGVLKHRRRKEKALRKLEGMATNLTRLQDLTAEIRRQLGPLAKQAQVARRASVIQAEVRDASARLLADDLAQAIARHEQEAADLSQIEAKQAELETEIKRADAQVAFAQHRIADASPAADRAAETWYRLSSLRERLRSLRALATQRVQLLSEVRTAQFGADPEELLAQAERTRVAEAELAAEVEAAATSLAAMTQAREIAEAKARESADEARELQRAIADRREGMARLAGRVETSRGKLEASELEIARLDAEIARLTAEVAEAERSYRSIEMEVADVEAGEIDLDAAFEAARDRLEQVQSSSRDLADSIQRASGEIATRSARLEALDLALTRKDGVGALLADQPANVQGSLAAAIVVEHGFEEAIDAALGPYANAVVVADDESATAALHWLHENDAGRAAIVICAVGDESVVVPAATGDGVRRALDVISTSAAITPALTALLGDVIVAPDLATARALRGRFPQLRVATTAGDLLGPAHGWGGSSSSPSVLQLQADYDDTARDLETVRATLAELTRRESDVQSEVASAQAEHDAALMRLHDSDAKISAVAAKLARIGEEMRRAQANIERLTASRAERESGMETMRADLAEAVQRYDAAQQDPAESQGRVEELVQELSAFEETAKRARGAETDAKLVLRTAQERARALAGKAEALTRTADQERQRRREAAQAEENRKQGIERAADVVTGIDTALTRLEASLQQAAAHRDETNAQRRELEREATRARDKREELRAEAAKLLDAAHREALAQAQHEARLEQVRQRAADELGIDPDVLVEEYGPHQGVPVVDEPDESDEDGGEPEPRLIPYVRAEQEKRLRAAQRAMSLLGKINPLAMEEHAALEERHRFLTEQLADIKRSRQDLLHIVHEVDERVEKVFAEAFADTEQQFERVFARLFPGGEGRLVLTDPADMLNTGVEVEARPAGKKVKRLSLLSGGERSLAAVAMLVAIFKARPSPFYVMDEVEAALDDVNLGRLLEIFKELQTDSQLIVITHQKRTMEIADALYGVTMRGDGVTTVISQRLTADA
ncbi:chromosome segregation protein SMC [Rarobacter faecitabidus]|uniref:Chromosome partition protein Smc n=1 Tax=Rarobacter faecitabidus TaxID=13243 RepID=A0A542ZWH9_RARFA|nr:chromosome segregation protein SMC [Rarobacter faecitabidus]TQL64715.1 condensin subunit Smc [Rarobacter faecitabidus]